MRRRRLVGLAVALLGGVAAVPIAGGMAVAATPVSYYVNHGSTACNDSGPGTLAQPFCTIAAGLAVLQPGVRLQITGTYAEHVTVAKSGTEAAPIVVTGGVLRGPDAGLTIDGQHDVQILYMAMLNVASGSAAVLRDSTRITTASLRVSVTDAVTAPAMTLTNVSDSRLQSVSAGTAGAAPAISIDSATTGVAIISPVVTGAAGTVGIDVYGSHNTIQGGTITGGSVAGVALHAGATDNVVVNSSVNSGSGAGIDVYGSHNTIQGGTITGGSVAGVALHAGATDNVVVNNSVTSGSGVGILDDGASGTAITNNDVSGNCASGIKVAGASSGVSVQNNIVNANGVAGTNCTTPAADAVNIGVYGGAVGQTTVDYNDVYQGGTPDNYAWQTPMTLDQFRSASGQAAHDNQTDSPKSASAVDSANSAAPGYQSTDRNSRARVDDVNLPDTGAGPITYADRGPVELGPGPQTLVQIHPESDPMTFSAIVYGPLGSNPVASYAFDFGDGTPIVTKTTGTASHTYDKPGRYVVKATTTDTYQLANTSSGIARAAQCTRTVGLLARANDRYVAPIGIGMYLRPDAVVPTWQQSFDLCVAGDGFVTLNAQGRFGVYADDSGRVLLSSSSMLISDASLFQMTTNADDTVSLKAVTNGKYVTAQNAGKDVLAANRTSVGTWEKFNIVDTAKQARSLRAHANNRFVTAENAGKSPLIANRTAVGTWEHYDIIDAGNGYVGLYSEANGKFVTAENAGKSPLIANRTTIGSWEKFQIVNNPDGSISLKANANGRYVTAESGGKSPLIANRTTLGSWEKFDLN